MDINSFIKQHPAGTTALLAIFLAGLTYVSVIQPWHMKWGTTQSEIEREIPGDDLMENATYVSTRAVTIDAAPSEIWPCLCRLEKDVAASTAMMGWKE